MFKGEDEVCEVTPRWEAAEEGGRNHQAQHQRAVKNLAATQAVRGGDNFDEGNSQEPPVKKAKQPGGWRTGPGPGWCRGKGRRLSRARAVAD
eukprot:jgi/Tetstr1/463577/TSEL_008456.t1